MLPFYVAAGALLLGGFLMARRAARIAQAQAATALARQLHAIQATAVAAVAASSAQSEAEGRERILELRNAAHEEASGIERRIAQREDELSARAQVLSAEESGLIARATALEARSEGLATVEASRKELEAARAAVDTQIVRSLEHAAGELREELRDRLVAEWVESARAAAADRLRRIEAGAADPEHGREAKRLMGIAIQRYYGHYLTERLLSNLPLAPGVAAKICGSDNANLVAIEEVANVKLALADDASAIRLEGQDSFGREIARRAIHRFTKHGVKGGDPKKATLAIKDDLEREVIELGRRAFKELEIPRAHPEIVQLVGRLNWRTSYTQNQWKHAVEAAFLCGMMAAELGLDVKLARRAALMHDIGKALTHAIDGSHAVIGADYARRLGEAEVVANAIGAHHADEPCNSVYATLVAASDAMSGARPGARREQTDNHLQRLDDLERIGGGFQGVERAFAVQGGREVRIYVKEDRVNDLRAVELSSEIARKISDELTFPGQIKVTVIREMRAIEIAG